MIIQRSSIVNRENIMPKWKLCFAVYKISLYSLHKKNQDSLITDFEGIKKEYPVPFVVVYTFILLLQMKLFCLSYAE